MAPATTPTAEPFRLRITVGNGEPKKWRGTLRLDRGSLSDLKLLSVDADAAGSAWLDRGELKISSLSPHKADSAEVAVAAASDASLVIDLSSGTTTAPAQARVPLLDLQQRPFKLSLDNQGNALEIVLVPEPNLEVAIAGDRAANDPLIFEPLQQLSFEMSPHLPHQLQGTTLDIQTTLTLGQKEVLWSDKQRLAVPVDGSQPRVAVNVPLQQPEGVYTVHIVISRPSGYFRDKFLTGGAPPLAERSFEIVVLDSRPRHEITGQWTQVLEIDPTNPRWVERLPSWAQFRRIPGLNHGAVGSLRAGSVDLPLGRFVELPPTTAGTDPHWQAYTLPIEGVGQPHMLQVEYPADKDQQFGLAIVEPNASGVAEGIQRDVGVYVEGLGRSEAQQRQTHRVLFWPRTQSPLLVVTNRDQSAAAHFGVIRVLRQNGVQNARPKSSAMPNRMVATYLARPLASETFGASKTIVALPGGGSESLDDDQSFYDAATRLADYVRYGGYNTAVVSAMAEGSSIFPCQQLLPTPRYDSGRRSRRLQDSDGLELALRIFDREKLTLVPAFEFATPLPHLEELRRASDPRRPASNWSGATAARGSKPTERAKG